MNNKKTYKKVIEKPRLEIYHEEYGDSPRALNSNLGYLITVDNRNYSPVEDIVKTSEEYAESQADHIKRIKEMIEKDTTEKVIFIYPIVKYEHSGVSYSLGTKNGFDYSNNGFYIITNNTAKEIGAKNKDYEKIIKEELKEFNQWLNGEIYTFVLYDQDGKIEEQISGFYDINEIKEYLPKEYQNDDLNNYLITK